MVYLSQNVTSIYFRCSKDFDFLATVLVRGGGGNVKRRSISAGTGIWRSLGIIAGVTAGATNICDTGGFSAATIGVIEFSADELNFSEILGVCILGRISINSEFFQKLMEQKVNYFHQMVPEMTSEWRRYYRVLGVTGFLGAIQKTVSSEIFESMVSSVKYFKLISVLSFIRLRW